MISNYVIDITKKTVIQISNTKDKVFFETHYWVNNYDFNRENQKKQNLPNLTIGKSKRTQRLVK